MDERGVVIEKGGSGVGAFVIGLAIGAGLALLFAPQSGAETRRTIAKGARRIRRAAAGAAGDVSEKVSDSFDEVRERVAEQIESARGALKSARGDVERAVQAGRDAAHDARHDIERRLTETKAAYRAGASVARERKVRSS